MDHLKQFPGRAWSQCPGSGSGGSAPEAYGFLCFFYIIINKSQSGVMQICLLLYLSIRNPILLWFRFSRIFSFHFSWTLSKFFKKSWIQEKSWKCKITALQTHVIPAARLLTGEYLISHFGSDFQEFSISIFPELFPNSLRNPEFRKNPENVKSLHYRLTSSQLQDF